MNNFVAEKTSSKKLQEMRLEHFSLTQYTKFMFCCGNKRLKRTIDYLNSLRSIEYLLSSFRDLTFFKYSQLTEKQIKTLGALPIKPAELIDNSNSISFGNIQIVKSYFEEMSNDNNEKDKFDNFFNSNFSVQK